MGNGFCQARCYLSLYYVRQGQRNDGFTSQPFYIVGKKKKEGKEELSWQGFLVQCVSGGESQSETGPDWYISQYWPITDVSGYWGVVEENFNVALKDKVTVCD